MKVQASGILILIACILTGCGKSMKDVAGVYETAEIKEPIKGTVSAYYSTTWVLDLVESGTFTLKEHKSRKHMQSQKYAPVPLAGIEKLGKWSLRDGKITITLMVYSIWDKYVAPDEAGYPDIMLKIPFDVQSAGDLVAGGQLDEKSVERSITFGGYDLKGLRFQRVE
tara:strand:+ start:126 stop:629 length:504 start_codon:yes stop_codon:yes gene_type:complete